MRIAIRLFHSDRSCLLLILLISLVLFTTRLGGTDLWDPDEPRAGVVTRAILKTGSWSVLYDNGAPYLEKPPLFFWLAALASLPSGRVTEFSLRLPSNIAAILCVVCVFYLGRALFGRRAGALAALVLATTQEFFLEARWAHPDMVFCLLLTFACFAFHEGFRNGWAGRWLLAAYSALGMAFLTKGPVALLPLVALGVFLAASRNFAELRRAGVHWGLPLVLLPTVLWLAAYRLSAGEMFPMAMALSRVAARVTEGVHHSKPFWYILVELPLVFLPWILLLPGTLAHTFPRRPWRDKESVYVYSFLVVFLTVFSISTEKRGVYLLPLLPLLSLLVGRVWDTALHAWEPSPVGRTIRWGLYAALAMAGVGTVYCVTRARAQAPGLQVSAVLLGGALILASLAALLVCLRRGGGAALATFSGGLVICYLLQSVAILPIVNRLKSARPFTARVMARVGEAPLGIYPDYHASFGFYSGRTLEVLRSGGELERFFDAVPQGFCLVEKRSFDGESERYRSGLEVLESASIGHRTMQLIGLADGERRGAGR